MNISKSDSEYIKGIGLLFMYIHHLFVSQNKMMVYTLYTPIHIYDNIRLELLVGEFGKICVPMFLFLSGYGFASIGKKHVSYYLNKIFRFFQVYWFYFVVFILFAPFVFLILSHFNIIGGYTFRFYFNIYEFFENFFAISHSYNGAWWFAEIYLGIILVTPLINSIRNNSLLILFLSLCSFCLAYIAYRFKFNNIDTPGISIIGVMYWQIPFVMGYLTFLNKNLFKIFFHIKKSIQFLLIIFLGTLSIFACKYMSSPGIMFATPLVIISCLLTKKLSSFLDGVFRLLGRYSFPMWLTHLFFSYHYCQAFIYFPKHPALILLNLIIVSLISVCFLEILRIKIQLALAGLVMSIRERFAVGSALPIKNRL